MVVHFGSRKVVFRLLGGAMQLYHLQGPTFGATCIRECGQGTRRFSFLKKQMNYNSVNASVGWLTHKGGLRGLPVRVD